MKIEEIIHQDGAHINALWWLYPKGNKGMFIFYSHGVTINFVRIENKYSYIMYLGTEIVATATRAVNQPIIAMLDPEYYSFVSSLAKSAQVIWG